MFDIGWSELVIVGIVALIVIGPKELPGVLRAAGQWIGRIRSMAADFQGQFQEAMREAEMADLKKQVDEIADSARDLTSEFDPIGSIEENFDDPFKDKPDTADAGAVEAPVQSGDAALPASVETAAEPPPAEAAAEPAVATADADVAPPPQKAAAGGHSA